MVGKKWMYSVACVLLFFFSEVTVSFDLKNGVIIAGGLTAAAGLVLCSRKSKSVSAKVQKMWKHPYRNKALCALLVASLGAVAYYKRNEIVGYCFNNSFDGNSDKESFGNRESSPFEEGRHSSDSQANVVNNQSPEESEELFSTLVEQGMEDIQFARKLQMEAMKEKRRTLGNASGLIEEKDKSFA